MDRGDKLILDPALTRLIEEGAHPVEEVSVVAHERSLSFAYSRSKSFVVVEVDFEDFF